MLKINFEIDNQDDSLTTSLPFRVRMKMDGDLIDEDQRWGPCHDTSKYEEGFVYFGTYQNPSVLEWNVNAVTQYAAIQIVDGKRQEIIKHNIWGDKEKVQELFPSNTNITKESVEDKNKNPKQLHFWYNIHKDDLEMVILKMEDKGYNILNIHRIEPQQSMNSETYDLVFRLKPDRR